MEEYEDIQEAIFEFINNEILPILAPGGNLIQNPAEFSKKIEELFSSEEFKSKLYEYGLTGDIIKKLNFKFMHVDSECLKDLKAENQGELIENIQNMDSYKLSETNSDGLKTEVCKLYKRIHVDDVEPINQDEFDRMMKL
jgi:hypothetical protein